MRFPPPFPRKGRRGTVINDDERVIEKITLEVRFALRGKRYDSSSWLGVGTLVCRKRTIHTIEMIPKSMILLITCIYVIYKDIELLLENG